MIRERAAPPKRVAAEFAAIPNAYAKVRRFFPERPEQGATIGSEHLAILGKDRLQLGRGKRCAIRFGSLSVCTWGSFQNPSLNSVLGYESQLFVEWFALRSSVQLHRGHFLLIEVLDGSFEQLGSNSLAAMLRVYQDHADPGKSVFEGDGGRGD